MRIWASTEMTPAISETSWPSSRTIATSLRGLRGRPFLSIAAPTRRVRPGRRAACRLSFRRKSQDRASSRRSIPRCLPAPAPKKLTRRPLFYATHQDLTAEIWMIPVADFQILPDMVRMNGQRQSRARTPCSRRPDMGNYRHPPADSQNERRRSANLAHSDAPAHRRRLAHLPNRKTHAVELQDLNGLSFALTSKYLFRRFHRSAQSHGGLAAGGDRRRTPYPKPLSSPKNNTPAFSWLQP
jgi:hypothetical protein